MGKVATFNSLSRDHFVNAIAYSEGSSMSSAFNSLSRDHAGEASGPRGSVGCHLSTPSLGITSLSRRPESDSKRSLSTPSLGITALVVGGYASATAGLNLSTPSLGITRAPRARVAAEPRHFQLPLSGSQGVESFSTLRAFSEMHYAFKSLSRDHFEALSTVDR